MLRVFFSYKRNDDVSQKVEAFDRGLRSAGFEVWRDIDLVEPTDANFVRTLDDAVLACDIGIVLWSRKASMSAAIAGEATKLAYMNKLINVSLEDAGQSVPAHFFAAQRFEFESWSGDAASKAFVEFIAALSERIKTNRAKAAGASKAANLALVPNAPKSSELIRSFVDLPVLASIEIPAAVDIGESTAESYVAMHNQFMISSTPITFGDWNYAARSGAFGVEALAAPGDDERYPVVGVSWRDAQNYVAWLNFRTQGLSHYRLPSESEWEFCAKRSHRKVLSAEPRMSPAGTVSESEWGVFDLPGWIWEWTEDYFVEVIETIPLDGGPRAQPISDFRAVRGRTWREGGREDGMNSRTGLHELFKADDVGFRVVKVLG